MITVCAKIIEEDGCETLFYIPSVTAQDVLKARRKFKTCLAHTIREWEESVFPFPTGYNIDGMYFLCCNVYMFDECIYNFYGDIHFDRENLVIDTKGVEF